MNTYTGVAYKDDPAILAWEAGPFLSAPVAWMGSMAAYMHNDLAMKQLFLDGGYYQGNNPSRFAQAAAQTGDAAYIDILSDRYTASGASPDFSAAIKTHAAISRQAQKPFILDSLGFSSPDLTARALEAADAYGLSGAFVESLSGHAQDGGFLWRRHSEGSAPALTRYGYHWPGFAENDGYNEPITVDIVRYYAYKINGQALPAKAAPWSGDAPTLQPILTPTAINWQGVVGAARYDVERAATTAGPWTVVGESLTDVLSVSNAGPLFSDVNTMADTEYYYRVIGHNEAGDTAYSGVYGPVMGDGGGFGENLLGGGDFETYYTPGVPKWQFKPTASGVFTLDGDDAVAGEKSGKITGGGELSVAFDVLPGVGYVLTYWMKTNAPNVKQTVLSRPYLGQAKGDPWWDYRGPGGSVVHLPTGDKTVTGGPLFTSPYGNRRQLGAVERDLSDAMAGRAHTGDGVWHQYIQVFSGGDLDIDKETTRATLIFSTPANSATYIDAVSVRRNLLTNGGFQNRGSRWSAESPWAILDPKGSSNITARLENASGGGAKLTQRVFVSPDTEYELRFRANTAAEDILFYLANEDGEPLTLEYCVPVRQSESLWDVVAAPFVSGSEKVAYLTVKDAGSGGEVRLDDFSLTRATPVETEEETLALTAGKSNLSASKDIQSQPISAGLKYYAREKRPLSALADDSTDFTALNNPATLSFLRAQGLSTDFITGAGSIPSATSSSSNPTPPYILSDNAAGWRIHPLASGSHTPTHQPSGAIAATADTSMGPNGTSTQITYSFNTGVNRTRRSFAEIRKPVDNILLTDDVSNVSLWLKGNGSNHRGILRLYFTDDSFADAALSISNTAAQLLSIPMANFIHVPTGAALDTLMGRRINAVAIIFTENSENSSVGVTVNDATIRVENIMLVQQASNPIVTMSMSTPRVSAKRGTSLNLGAGLVISPDNADRDLVWTSSAVTTASVDANGVVICLKAGTVVITCKDMLTGKLTSAVLTITS